MKVKGDRYLVILGLVVFLGGLGVHLSQEEAVSLAPVEHYNPSFSDLLDAIEWVESRGGPNAVGPGGEIGLYQISEVYVDDINRMLGENKYTYADRWDAEKSRVMVAVYLRYYEENSAIKYPYYREGAGWRNSCDLQTPFERMARIHNGGPNGYRKAATKIYWLKVKERLESK